MNLNKLKVNFQYFMPKQLLTRLIGFIASAKLGKFTTFLIKQFIANYRVNTQEMVGTISDYYLNRGVTLLDLEILIYLK